MRGHGPAPTSHSRPFPTIVVAIGTYINGSVAVRRPGVTSTEDLGQDVLPGILLITRVSFLQCRRLNDRNPLGI